MEEGLLDSHASTIIAEVKGYVSVSPDILLGYCARLRFDLDLVWMVVAPCGAVAPAYGALTDIGIFGQSWHCDRDGAAVTAGADWSVFCCHLCLFVQDLGCEVGRCCNSDLSKVICLVRTNRTRLIFCNVSLELPGRVVAGGSLDNGR